MSEPVPAKISRPRLLQVLARPRLLRALDRARECPVVWISAPPGAGKTTLVSHYLEQRKLRNLWYQVDEGDSDIATPFYYLALAARRATPRARKPLPQLASEHVGNPSGFFRLFFQALFGRLKTAPVLVIDDYHALAADALFHEAVSAAIAQIPRGGNLFILSRGDPPAALARAQVNGLVSRLDWDALKLTPQEARQLVQLKKKSSLSQPLQEQLYALCQGWIAGLLLLLEASATQDLYRFARREFAPQVLFDYFGSQIFDRMDAAEQEILMQTAFLPKMILPALQRLTGAAQAGRLVEDLHRRNYFVVRHGEEPPVFEYHPLFRNFLLNRAAAMFAVERLRCIMQRAAAVLAESGQFEDAVSLHREIDDEAGIVRIIVQHAPSLMKQGRTDTILGWTHALSEQTLQLSSWVQYWLGVCTLAAQPARSRAFFERALELFDAESDAAGVYLSWSALVNSIIYSWHEYQALDRWIGALDELRARYGDFPSVEIEARVTGSMFAALLFRQPAHPRIGFWEQRIQALLSSVGEPALAVLVGVPLLNYYVWCGYLSKARLLLEALDAHVLKPTTPAVLLLHWRTMAAAYCWSTGDYDACSRILAQTNETAEKQGRQVFAAEILTQQVHVHLGRGDFQSAAATLEEVRESLLVSRGYDLGRCHFLVSMTALFQDDPALARESIEVALRATRQCGAAFPQVAAHFGAAQVAFAEGDHEKSAAHVAQGRALMSSVTVDYFCLLYEARLAFTRGEQAAGLRSLRGALALARQHGLVHSLWWSPAAMTEFYVKALDGGIETAYVRSVIRKRGLVPEGRVHCPDWPRPLKIYTLGGLRIEKDGKALRFAGKVQRRPLDLLKITIALGGREVDTRRITDGLWPDGEGDAAEDAFATALRRLRLLLGDPAALVLQDGKLSIDAHRVWVDVWALEHLLERKDTGPAEFAGVLALYQGPFLENEPGATWAWPLRERLRNRFLRELARQGQRLLQDAHCEEAIQFFEKGLEVDELAEELYCKLMRCYQALGRRAEALGIYERCRKLLSATLGVSPSPATEALGHALREQPVRCSG